MTSLPSAVVLLAKSVVGAATASIPAMLAALGAPAGAALVTALAAASAASTGVVLASMRATGAPSYQAATLAVLGPGVAALLDAASALFGWGMLVVYCGMVADTLVGRAGLVCGGGGGEGAAAAAAVAAAGAWPGWLCTRAAAAPALAALVFMPLSLAPSLADSAGAAWAGAAAVAVWAGIGVGAVAWAAATGGRLWALPLWPDGPRLAALGGWGGGPVPPPAWRLAKGAATAAGVVTSALVTQLTAPPVAAGLAPGPRPQAATHARLVWAALAACVVAYLAVALPALALLGPAGVRDDVLEGWTPAALAPALGWAGGRGGGGGGGPGSDPDLIPSALAAWAAGGVRAAFAGALATMFPLMMWPTREAVGRLWAGGAGAVGAWRGRRRRGEGDGEAPLLVEGGGEAGEEGAPPPPPPLLDAAGRLTGRPFFVATAVLTASSAAVAVAVPDAAAALAVVGAGAGAVVAFFIPAALCGAAGNAAGAAGLALVGCSMVGAVV